MELGCIWDVSGIYLGVSAFWLGCLMFCGSHVCMAYGTGSGAVGVRGATGCNTTCVVALGPDLHSMEYVEYTDPVRTQ